MWNTKQAKKLPIFSIPPQVRGHLDAVPLSNETLVSVSLLNKRGSCEVTQDQIGLFNMKHLHFSLSFEKAL